VKPRKTLHSEIRKLIKLFPNPKDLHRYTVYPADFLTNECLIAVEIQRDRHSKPEIWEFSFVLTAGKKIHPAPFPAKNKL